VQLSIDLYAMQFLSKPSTTQFQIQLSKAGVSSSKLGSVHIPLQLPTQLTSFNKNAPTTHVFEITVPCCTQYKKQVFLH